MRSNCNLNRLMKDRISENFRVTYKRKILSGEEIDLMEQSKPGKVFKDITGIHGVGNKSKLRKAVSYARDIIVREQLAAKRKDAISKFKKGNKRNPTAQELKTLLA